MKRPLSIAMLGTLATILAACSSTSDNTTTNGNTASTATTTNRPTANTAATPHGTATTDETPAAVRAALPEAQTFTMQHKDIPATAIASIEKETGASVTNKDHHSYLAFSTAGGARRQVGAATVVEVDGGEMIIIYDSKEGSPVIREIRGGNVPEAFLANFKGKGHDDALVFGNDIKAAGGVSESAAKSVTAAIKRDVLAMQALYGAAHTH